MLTYPSLFLSAKTKAACGSRCFLMSPSLNLITRAIRFFSSAGVKFFFLKIGLATKVLTSITSAFALVGAL